MTVVHRDGVARGGFSLGHREAPLSPVARADRVWHHSGEYPKPGPGIQIRTGAGPCFTTYTTAGGRAFTPAHLPRYFHAMTDFTNLIANPKLIPCAGQVRSLASFCAHIVSRAFRGFYLFRGGSDWHHRRRYSTAIFITTVSLRAAPASFPIAISAYSYMALIPSLSALVMRALTTKKEPIKMKPPRKHPA